LKDRDRAANIDKEVVHHFGKEWAKFNYSDGLADSALDNQFKAYTKPLDLKCFSSTNSIAADFGAGSGRWAKRIAPFFQKIYVLEPSIEACQVLNTKFANSSEFIVLNESVESNSIPDQSLDFAMSLGVLHHIPNTQLAITDICNKLKSGGVFLCYLYYKVEDKPFHYQIIFRLVDSARFLISRLPHFSRMIIAKIIAATIYLPLSRFAKFAKKRGKDISNIPLHHYAEMPFVMLENDALDRFGTRLEQRFNKEEISEMLRIANFDLSTLIFSADEPFWTFTVKK